MSNWLRAQISTEIKNPRRDLFDQALEDMGFVPDYSKKTVHGSFSYESTEPVNCVLLDKETNEETTIGFGFKELSNGEIQLSVSGDFFGLEYDGRQFMKKLAMYYNYELTKENLEEQGYTIEDTEVKEHEIVFVGRMAA